MARDALARRSNPPRRLAFVLILAACWLLGLIGLDRGRIASLHLPLVVAAAAVGYAAVGAIRRHVEHERDAFVPHAVDTQQTCVVLRWLGEGRPQPVATQERPSAIVLELPMRAQRVDPTPKRAVQTRRPQGYIPLTGI